MPNTVTIRFRAKLDDFAGGRGYKVPRLTSSHVTFSERDTLATLVTGSLERAADNTLLKARLSKFAGGFDLPGVVWEGNHDGWTVTPRGNGFMADVEAVVQLTR